MESHPMRAPSVMLFWFILTALVFYLRTLRGVLQKCAPASRTMTPEKVWLILIPFFGLIWQFIVVRKIATSLGNEFARLGISYSDARPGQSVGLACCVCNCCIFLFLSIPVLCGLATLASFVLWMVYWIGMANCSRLLETHHGVASASPVA